jgi:hypothetical protein
MSGDFVSEENCTLCSQMWPSERSVFRADLDTILLGDKICNGCLMAWARNVGFPVRDDDATGH